MSRKIYQAKLTFIMGVMRIQKEMPVEDWRRSTVAGPSAGSKHTFGHVAKGAIFREVVLAKVREAKEHEHALQVEKEAQDKAAKQNSFQGGQ